LKPDRKSICESLKNDGLGPRKHGLTGNNNSKINSEEWEICETDLDAFFGVLVTGHGDPQEMQLVCTKTNTGIRDAEIDLVELPSDMSK
jgi:hypothetical protein